MLLGCNAFLPKIQIQIPASSYPLGLFAYFSCKYNYMHRLRQMFVWNKHIIDYKDGIYFKI